MDKKGHIIYNDFIYMKYSDKVNTESRLVFAKGWSWGKWGMNVSNWMKGTIA